MRKADIAGGVVVNSNGEVLVVNQNHNSWSLPKGHIEEGENVLAAAKREIYEESGVRELVLIKPLPSYKRFSIGPGGEEDRSKLKTRHMFLFKTKEEKLQPVDPENPEAKWMSPLDVADILTHPKDKEFFCGILYELENIK